MRYEEDDTDTDDSKGIAEAVTVFGAVVIAVVSVCAVGLIAAVIYVLFMFGSWLGGQ